MPLEQYGHLLASAQHRAMIKIDELFGDHNRVAPS